MPCMFKCTFSKYQGQIKQTVKMQTWLSAHHHRHHHQHHHHHHNDQPQVVIEDNQHEVGIGEESSGKMLSPILAEACLGFWIFESYYHWMIDNDDDLIIMWYRIRRASSCENLRGRVFSQNSFFKAAFVSSAAQKNLLMLSSRPFRASATFQTIS